MDNYEVNNQNSSNNNTSAIVGMILGIVSIVLCWIPLIGLVLAIVGLILGVKGLKKSKATNTGKGCAIAGISCGSVGIVFSIIYTIVWIFTAVLVKNIYEEVEDEYDSYKTTRYNYTYDYDYDDYNYNSKYKNSILNNYYY